MLQRKIATIVNRMLWRFNLQLRRTRPNMHSIMLEGLFYKLYHDNFFFVQVGANDGRSGDPIHELVARHNLAGLAIEPLPDLFEQLRKTYRKSPKVKLANIAIHTTEQEVTLYRVRAGAVVPGWAHGIASLNPRHYELCNDANLQFNPNMAVIDSSDIIEEKVPADSLDSVLKRYEVKHIDLFQVDTEGYDEEILRMLLATEFRPKIISFERVHMSSKAYRDLTILLMDNEYCVSTFEWDAIAWRL